MNPKQIKVVGFIYIMYLRKFHQDFSSLLLRPMAVTQVLWVMQVRNQIKSNDLFVKHTYRPNTCGHNSLHCMA